MESIKILNLMDLFALKLFKDIAQEKSFSKAATLNFRTQSAVSFHIKNLERSLGAKLLERTSRKISLTRAGEFLLSQCEEILQKCDNLKALIHQNEQAPEGIVKIATIHSVGIYELAPILKKFIRTYPKISIHLQYLKSNLIYDLVRKNEIELGLVAFPVSSERLRILSFGVDRMVLITPPQHPLAKKRSIDLEEMSGHTIVTFNPDIPTGEMLTNVFAQKKLQLQVQRTHENIDTIKRSVEVGLGISIVPSNTVREEIDKNTLKAIRIRNVNLERPLGIIIRKDCPLDYPAKLLLEMLQANARNSTLNGSVPAPSGEGI